MKIHYIILILEINEFLNKKELHHIFLIIKYYNNDKSKGKMYEVLYQESNNLAKKQIFILLF